MVHPSLRNKVLAVLVAMVMAVAVAACGGGGDDPVVESSGNESPTTERSDDDASRDDDDRGSGSGGLGMFGDDECTNVGLAYATISIGALGAMFGGAMGDEDLEELEAELDEMRGEIPSQLRDDFDVIQDAFAEFGEVLGDGGGNIMDPAYAEKMEEAAAALDSDEVTEAQENIQEWLEDNCAGFDFEG